MATCARCEPKQEGIQFNARVCIATQNKSAPILPRQAREHHRVLSCLFLSDATIL
eukprot:COSAG06_NODE_4515_length_4189_cov_12.834230_6_plen_55_part_00